MDQDMSDDSGKVHLWQSGEWDHLADADEDKDRARHLLQRALIAVEAHAEEYPDARPLAEEIRRYLDESHEGE
jgi:hypothetical protein